MRTDTELISMLRQNSKKAEKSALQQIYNQNLNGIRQYILNNSGKEEDVKEVFHDGIIALVLNIREKELELTVNLKAYLFKICKNKWLERLRKNKMNYNLALDDSFNQPSNDQLISTKIVLEEGQKLLHELLSSTKGDCQKIFRMFFVLKKKMTEIAETMGLENEKVVRNRKYVCLKKVRKLVEQNPIYKRDLKEYLSVLTKV